MNILSKYDVTVDETKDAAIAAFAERTSLVGKLNSINEEIKAREEHLFWLTHYLDVSLSDLDLLTIGMVNEMFIEKDNDDYDYPIKADQNAMDSF